MRHIQKLPSPVAFESWKQEQGRSAAYDQLNSPRHRHIKILLREQLVHEQLGLCCYCGIALSENNIHIEHHQPQSTYRAKQLDYENLHVSCKGKETFPNPADELTFCGHSKGNWYDPTLTVSPLDPSCESYFKFSADGGIYSTEVHPGAEETIRRLGLDTYLINNLRKAAIDLLLENINWDDPVDVDKWLQLASIPDHEHRLPSFSSVLLYFIRSFQ